MKQSCGPLTQIDRCNVVWETAGKSDRDSMPLGNGEVGASLWIEEGGDMRFYLARTDALTELDRNVKLGMVRLKISPNPFVPGIPFRQTLKLRDGAVEVTAGDVVLRVFVDSEFPTVHIVGKCGSPRVVTATYHTWRTAPRPPGGDAAVTGAPPIRDLSRAMELLQLRNSRCPNLQESPDVVETSADGVLFYHRNGATCIPFLADLEGLKEHLGVIPDLLGNRIFGGWLTLSDAIPTAEGGLATARAVDSFALRVTTHSAQAPAVNRWIKELLALDVGAVDAERAAIRTAAWWRSYWEKSWLFIEGDEGARHATRAYVHTKWLLACSARGAFPIRYNGALFNLMPAGNGKLSVFTMAKLLTEPPPNEPNLAVNPDIRPWSHNNYYQNQRLPYLSMLPRGEAESLRALFRFYRRFWDLDRVRAVVYHGAEGQHNADNTMTFGLLQGGIYGFDRSGLPVGCPQDRHTGGISVSPGLELIQLMLDYHEYTDDEKFLEQELLPYARDLLRYVETRFRERRGGKIVIAPLNAVETYWDATDPVTVVAGMHAVLGRLLSLASIDERDRAYFVRLRDMTPPIPLETVDGETVIAPARAYDSVRHNVEAPQYYAVFPFRLYGLGKPGLDVARATYAHAAQATGSSRPFAIGWTPDQPSYSGWQQHGMTAAVLGLDDVAREIVVNNSRLVNPGCRFPAMWGPIYDAVPDVDHGANLLTTLQLMAFQADGDRILVLPAWPRGWDVSFRFEAPHHTMVSCVYQDGRVEALEITPPDRAKDVEVFRGMP